MLGVQSQEHPDMDLLKKDARRSVLYQLEYFSLEFLAFCASLID